MKKDEKEPSKIKAGPAKGAPISTPLTPEELREMYVMVKEIHHQLGLGPRQRSMVEFRRQAGHDIARLQERQARKKEGQEKKE